MVVLKDIRTSINSIQIAEEVFRLDILGGKAPIEITMTLFQIRQRRFHSRAFHSNPPNDPKCLKRNQEMARSNDPLK